MSQKSGNNVKPPAGDDNQFDNESAPPPTKDGQHLQHHGENQEALQDDRKIGQSNGTGRPPLMKK